MKKVFRPEGVCTYQMDIEVEDGVIKSVYFDGGCDGNLQAISRLLQGMTVFDAIKKTKGIRCETKETSCPDQLSKALEEFL